MHAHLMFPAVPMGAQYILYLPCDHADRSLFSAHMSLHMFCSPYYVTVTSHFIFTCQTLCLVYKWCDVHPNVIVVLCLHSCVPVCLQNVLFFFAFEPLLLSGHATFPRHSPHHSCSRLLRFHSFFHTQGQGNKGNSEFA